ncbi:hypothetical protein RRG08_052902 [Elysia crispata]|uniref:Uncharacterized protein n=1 Tax=Elysia crispata TaxID=231223 RepID=A0AAE1DEI5_9GAST|nr:hypothetical protein RRG08_052902 [Elysia crispata]
MVISIYDRRATSGNEFTYLPRLGRGVGLKPATSGLEWGALLFWATFASQEDKIRREFTYQVFTFRKTGILSEFKTVFTFLGRSRWEVTLKSWFRFRVNFRPYSHFLGRSRWEVTLKSWFRFRVNVRPYSRFKEDPEGKRPWNFG